MPTHGGIREDQRRALCGTAATLDGEPARITGWANPFAAVSRTDGRGGSVEFAWPTAVRIAEAGGAFQS